MFSPPSAVCEQDISKSYRGIQTKFGGHVGCLMRTKWFDFGEDPNPRGLKNFSSDSLPFGDWAKNDNTAWYFKRLWTGSDKTWWMSSVSEHDLYLICLWSLNNRSDGIHKKLMGQTNGAVQNWTYCQICPQRKWEFWNDLWEKDALKSKQMFWMKFTLAPPFLSESHCYSALRAHSKFHWSRQF